VQSPFGQLVAVDAWTRLPTCSSWRWAAQLAAAAAPLPGSKRKPCCLRAVQSVQQTSATPCITNQRPPRVRRAVRSGSPQQHSRDADRNCSRPKRQLSIISVCKIPDQRGANLAVRCASVVVTVTAHGDVVSLCIDHRFPLVGSACNQHIDLYFCSGTLW